MAAGGYRVLATRYTGYTMALLMGGEYTGRLMG